MEKISWYGMKIIYGVISVSIKYIETFEWWIVHFKKRKIEDYVVDLVWIR